MQDSQSPSIYCLAMAGCGEGGCFRRDVNQRRWRELQAAIDGYRALSPSGQQHHLLQASHRSYTFPTSSNHTIRQLRPCSNLATRHGQPHTRRCHGQVSTPRRRVVQLGLLQRLTLDAAVRDTPNSVSPATTLPLSFSLPPSQPKALLLAAQEDQAPAAQPLRTSPLS